jgi:hypothetical protein
LHGFGNRFGILVIALIGLHEGTDELWWNQPHFVPLRDQSGAKVMSATAGFHTDETGGRVGKLAEQLTP